MAIRTTGVRYDLIARDSASRTFDQVAGRASVLDRGIGKLARTVTLAGTALAGALVVGLGESAKKAVEFQSSMQKIQTQAGGTAKDVAVLSKGVLELGKTAEQGPQQLSEAMYHLKSVGLDNVSALKDLKVASDLAAVGGSDLEDTTNALAGAWRSGIKGADTFSKAASTVNAVLGAGNMRMSDFVEAIGTGILPAAKSFGLSLSQVGSALALMTDEGIPAVDAATRLRMSFSLLGAPSGAADKQLKKIGLTGLDLAQAMRGPQGLIGAVGLLKDHLDKSGMSAAQTSQLLSRAFGGGKSDSAILTMINNYDVLRQKQDQVNSSMGKFPAAVAAQRKTAEAQLKILESNLDVLAIQIGTKTLPVLSGFVQFLNKTALPALSGLGNAFLHLIPVDQIKAGFSTAEGLVSDFLNGFNPKTPKKQTITLPTPTIKAPTTVIPNDLRRPDLIVPSPTLKMGTTPIPGTLAAPAAVTSQATKLGEQLRNAFSGGIGDAIGRIDWGKLGKHLADGIGTAVGWVGQHAADLSKKLGAALLKVDWVDVGKSLGALALPLAIGIVNNLFAPLFTPSFWEHHWLDLILAALSFIEVGRIAGVLGKVFEKIPYLKAAKPLLDGIAGIGKGVEKGGGLILKAVGKVVGAIGKGFLDGFEHVFPGISEAAGKKVDDLALAIFGYWARFGAAGLRLVEGLGNGILKGGRIIGRPVGQVIGWVLKPFAKAGGWLLKAGGDLLSGLKTGIVDGAKSIGRWLDAHLVNPVVSWVKSLFGIHSPSTVFAGIGRNLVYGLTGGIAAAAAGIGRWLYSHVVAPVLGAFSGAGSWLYGRGRAVVSGLMNGVWSVAKGIGGWVFGRIADPVIGAFRGAGGWLYHAGLDLMSGLESGIARGFHSVLDYLGGVGGSISRAVGGAASSLGGIIGKIPGLATGGLAPIGQTAWVGERGPELMQVTPRGTRIYNNRDSKALAGVMGVRLPGYASGTVPAAQVRVDDAREALYRARRRRLGIKAAETRLKAAEQELANARRATRLAVSDTLQNGFLKSLETGTAAGIASAIKSMNTKLQAAGAGYLVAGNLRTSARLQSLANQRSSIQSRIATARQYASDQASGLGDFLSITGTGATNVSDLIAQMRSGQSTAGRFASEVSSLSRRGLSKTLLSQLAQAGPGSQLAAVLAGASPEDIRQLNKVATSQNKLTTSFGRTMADAMYDSGKMAGHGFLSGLQAQEKQIQAEMDKLALGMVTTIKKKLGIRSPSTVLRDQVGKQVALGAAVGVRQYAPHAVREAQRMADTMAAVRARTGTAARPTASSATRQGGGQFTGRLYLDSGQFLGVVQGMVEPMVREGVEQGHVELTAALRAGGVA